MAPMDINSIRNKIREEISKLKTETQIWASTKVTHDIIEIMDSTTSYIDENSSTTTQMVLDVKQPFLEDFVDNVS